METIIREYRDEDRKAMEKHMEDFQHHLMELDPFDCLICPPGYGEHYITKLLETISESNGRLFMAEQDSIVGFLALVPEELRWDQKLSNKPSRSARIIELYVAADVRGKGVGAMLMKAAEMYAREGGYDEMCVSVFSPNTQAHGFYRKCGYADSDVELCKKLGTGVE